MGIQALQGYVSNENCSARNTFAVFSHCVRAHQQCDNKIGAYQRRLLVDPSRKAHDPWLDAG
jgi:hypothetical protein